MRRVSYGYLPPLAQTPYVNLITRAQALETGLSVADKETEIGTECLQLTVFSTQLGEHTESKMEKGCRAEVNDTKADKGLPSV